MNKLRMLLNRAWVIVAACVAVFFATALTVYVKAEPESVSELLTRDGTEPNVEQLCSTSGDLEEYPYVTKVYRYETNAERLNVTYFKKEHDYDMAYGVVENTEQACDYCAEFFVYSDIADKTLVKRLWNISVTETQGITLTQTNAFNVALDTLSFKDLKKEYSPTPRHYTTFVRISVKSGSNDIRFDNIVR